MRGLSLVSVVAFFGGCAPSLSDVPEAGPSPDLSEGSVDGGEDVVEFERSCGVEPTDAEVEAMELQFDLDRGVALSPDVPMIPVVTSGTIDVYFHVIRSGNTGNLTQAQVDDQIDVLNAAYASTGWQFNLVSTDWTNNATWFGMSDGSAAESAAKSALRQGSGDDLNLYSARPSFGILGWATFPNSYALRPTDDGVVIHYGTLPGGNQAPYDEGDTAVHEVGHWMGLYHTFQGACGAAGDRIADTPSERYANYGCPWSRNSCAAQAGNDPIQNYMDYSEDGCMYEFTADQDYRMDDQFSIYRYGN
jgi:hypothetical protein